LIPGVSPGNQRKIDFHRSPQRAKFLLPTFTRKGFVQ